MTAGSGAGTQDGFGVEPRVLFSWRLPTNTKSWVRAARPRVSRLACSRISAGDPTRSSSASGLVRLASASTASVWDPRVPTRRRRGRWMSEPGDGGTRGRSRGSGAHRSERLG